MDGWFGIACSDYFMHHACWLGLKTMANTSGGAGLIGWCVRYGQAGVVLCSHGATFVTLLLLCCVSGEGRSAQVAGVSPELSALIARCAPTVHPETMAAVISAESRGHLFAIADAGPKGMPWAQRKALVRSYYLDSVDSAVAKASGLIANGHTVSLGPAQVNDRNLPALGLSVRDVFDPCTNVAAGGKILTEFYMKAARQFGAGPRALRAALSAYNSGSWVRGEQDGYVRLVFDQLGKPLSLRADASVPRLAGGHVKTKVRASVVDSSGRLFALSTSEFRVTE